MNLPIVSPGYPSAFVKLLRMRHHKFLIIQAASVATLAFLTPHATFAATLTWNGTGNDWNTTGDWNSTPAAIPAAADTVLFNSLGNTNPAVSLAASVNVKTITFTSGAGAYTIGGAGTLTLTTGGTISADNLITGPEVISNAITLGNATGATSYTFASNSANAANTLNFGGNITGDTNATATTTSLTLSGSNKGLNTLSGNLSDGTGALSLTMGGGSTWLLSGNNTGMTGGVIMGIGSTLLIGSNTALGTGTVTAANLAGTCYFGAGAANVTVSNDFTLNSNCTTTFVGSGNLTINGTFTPIRITNVSFFNLGKGTLTFGGSFKTSGNGNYTVMDGTGDMIFAGTIDNGGQLVNIGTGKTTISGVNNAGGYWGYGGTLVLDTSSSGTRLAGTLNLGGVMLNLSGGTSNQTVTSTTFRMGQTIIQDTNSGSAQIALGSITAKGAAMVNFGAGVATTTTGNSSGILGGMYTFGGTDWAVGNGSTTAISGYSSYTLFASVAGSTTNYVLTGNGAISSSIAQNTLKISSTGSGQSLTIEFQLW
jgi:fibronectin-binding autotransporter adhesin